MPLKGVLFSRQELNIARPQDPERFVMEDALTELLDTLPHYGAQAIQLDAFCPSGPQELSCLLSLHHIPQQEALLVAATDRSLALADGLAIATLGYRNPFLPPQSLRQPEIVVEGFEEVDFHFLEQTLQRRHNIPWTVLETRRCILREMELEDLDALYRLYQGASAARFLEPLYEREKEEEYTRAYITNMYRFYGYGMWVAIEKSSGEIIGRAGIQNQSLNGEAVLELGYLVGEPYQNQGYATELCQAILEYAREKTGFSEISCLIAKENVISVHLALKLGFTWQEEVEIKGKTLQRYKKTLQFQKNVL